MTRNGTQRHPSEPGYDPVLDGVSRGLEALFPPIDNPLREGMDTEDEMLPSDAEREDADTR